MGAGAVTPMTLRRLLLLFWILCAVTPVAAETADTSPTLPLLRVGFLRREDTGHPGEAQLEKLRDRLLQNNLFMRELWSSGFGGIGLYSCDGASDMIRRLGAREFDVAFTPAAIYMTATANYSAILKTRRQGDIVSPSNYVRRYGVVFVSSRSPLFGVADLTPELVRKNLALDRIAVVSTQSVAGFHAPLLTLRLKYGANRTQGGYLWFESSDEVVKGVLSGLADIGACEKQSLDETMKQEGLERERDKYVRVLAITDPVITDPIVIRRDMPRQGALGRALRREVRDYSLTGGLGEFQYVEANDDEYRSLAQLLSEFDEKVGEVPR
ncbi:hypothetical protein BH09SUM1_BH09SUM1_06050 [soil metagenome]